MISKQMNRSASRAIAALAALVSVDAAAAQSVPADITLEAPGPLGPLQGSLIDVGKGRPVVLIVPGSGPTDRNGDNPLGVSGGVYRQLAEGLAMRGISSVRIDKRGMFGSAKAVADPHDVTIGAMAGDVHSWAKVVRARTGASCVWVLGHSEGGLVALMAGQDARDICGLMLVSAPGRRLSDVIRAQLKANPANAPVLDQAMTAIASLEAGKTFDPSSLHPALLPLFNAKVQPYMIDMFSKGPAALAAAYRGRMLIVQGDHDIQVSLEDARLLKAAQPKATLVELPGVNHVLRSVTSDDRAANVATYGDAALKISPTVADAIAAVVLH